MTTSRRTSYIRRCTRAAAISALLLSGSATAVEAQTTGKHAISPAPAPRVALGHIAHAVAMSEQSARTALSPRWSTAPVLPGRRWPLRADPRRWPRLYPNTSEGTLSFDPVLRRYWFQ